MDEIAQSAVVHAANIQSVTGEANAQVASVQEMVNSSRALALLADELRSVVRDLRVDASPGGGRGIALARRAADRAGTALAPLAPVARDPTAALAAPQPMRPSPQRDGHR